MKRTFKELERENQQLRQENKQLREQLSVATEMHRDLSHRTSKNSSVPPSTDFKANVNGPRKRGGARAGHTAQLHELLSKSRVDEERIHKADVCPRCGSHKLVEKKMAKPFQFIDLREGPGRIYEEDLTIVMK